jgi:hypothetical protein
MFRCCFVIALVFPAVAADPPLEGPVWSDGKIVSIDAKARTITIMRDAGKDSGKELKVKLADKCNFWFDREAVEIDDIKKEWSCRICWWEESNAATGVSVYVTIKRPPINPDNKSRVR